MKADWTQAGQIWFWNLLNIQKPTRIEKTWESLTRIVSCVRSNGTEKNIMLCFRTFSQYLSELIYFRYLKYQYRIIKGATIVITALMRL